MSYEDFNAKIRFLFDERGSGNIRLATKSTTNIPNTQHIYNTSGNLRPWRGQFPSGSVGLTSWGCNTGNANGTYKPDWDISASYQIPDGVTYTAYVENKISNTYPTDSGPSPVTKTFSGRITTLPSIL